MITAILDDGEGIVVRSTFVEVRKSDFWMEPGLVLVARCLRMTT